jgi:sugar phosphate isomerase/epimerase
MLIGGHLASRNDAEFLLAEKFDFGEVVFRNDSEFGLLPQDITQPGAWGPLPLLGHAPREGNPSDLRNIWEVYFPRILNCTELAGRAGISLLTVHLWMDTRFIAADIIAEKRRFLREAVTHATKHGVTLGLENLSESAQDMANTIDAAPGLAITLDVGHAQLLQAENTSVSIIRLCGSAVRHLHLHDNRGGNSVKDDLHLPIGHGVIDFPSVLAELQNACYEGTATLEVEQRDLVSCRATLMSLLGASSSAPGA